MELSPLKNRPCPVLRGGGVQGLLPHIPYERGVPEGRGDVSLPLISAVRKIIGYLIELIFFYSSKLMFPIEEDGGFMLFSFGSDFCGIGAST